MPFESEDSTALEDLSPQGVHAMLQGSQFLGFGSYGNVYAVRYKGQTCALKVARNIADCTLRSELEFLQSIAGAGGAPVPLAFCPERDALLMSFCGKDGLHEYLRRGGFSLQHVLSVALRVTERLQELHRAGFVHGDLKCNNVTVKLDAERNLESSHLIDFGLSARIGERFPPRKKPRNMQWYCSCRHKGSPLLPPCDLPGLATIL